MFFEKDDHWGLTLTLFEFVRKQKYELKFLLFFAFFSRLMHVMSKLFLRSKQAHFSLQKILSSWWSKVKTLTSNRKKPSKKCQCTQIEPFLGGFYWKPSIIGKPQKAFFSSSLREVRAVWGTKKMLSEVSSRNFKPAVKSF